MAGKFVLKNGSTGKYHVNLVASNRQVIATSEAYELDRPGNLGGSDSWEDAGSCRHSGSTLMSCASAR